MTELEKLLSSQDYNQQKRVCQNRHILLLISLFSTQASGLLHHDLLASDDVQTLRGLHHVLSAKSVYAPLALWRGARGEAINASRDAVFKDDAQAAGVSL